MISIKQQKRTKWTRLLMKFILVNVSTALIVYFMPRGDEFGYKYELNKPWNYGLLIANTKFPVLKNDSTIRKEREATSLAFQPYYHRDKLVRDNMMNRLYQHDSNGKLGKGEVVYMRHIAALLDTIYKHGVMSIDDYERLKNVETRKRIRVVDDNVAVSLKLSDVFTPKSAYDYIMTKDTLERVVAAEPHI